MSKEPTQEELREFVNNHVYVNQSMLVDELLKKEIFNYEEIENFYQYICSECGGNRFRSLTDREIAKMELSAFSKICLDCKTTFGDEAYDELQQSAEIFEWWIVSEWLANQLKAEGEPILNVDEGTWWGRTCTGQAIFLDGTIKHIYQSLKS